MAFLVIGGYIQAMEGKVERAMCVTCDERKFARLELELEEWTRLEWRRDWHYLRKLVTPKKNPEMKKMSLRVEGMRETRQQKDEEENVRWREM